MKVAGVPVLLAAWAVPRDKSSLVWALMPRAPPWGSEDKAKVLLECIEGTETDIFLSGLQEDSWNKITKEHRVRMEAGFTAEKGRESSRFADKRQNKHLLCLLLPYLPPNCCCHQF